MRNYEVTFIVDPMLSGDEVRSVAQAYQNMMVNEKVTLVHLEEMGLRQLAYPIKKRSTGVYYCLEFATENPAFISQMELAMKRDERILRFLTVALDKYAVKYNQDKRDGKIGKRPTREKSSVSARQEMAAQATAASILLEEE